ncbi:hypothetical protein, partial [Xanthomonas euvesicatoria]|uniref:hypothetical protein n=1 Tax=Xanthomonas euvesicatoria TaxID=456327 RepID=UPI001C20A2E1
MTRSSVQTWHRKPPSVALVVPPTDSAVATQERAAPHQTDTHPRASTVVVLVLVVAVVAVVAVVVVCFRGPIPQR